MDPINMWLKFNIDFNLKSRVMLCVQMTLTKEVDKKWVGRSISLIAKSDIEIKTN